MICVHPLYDKWSKRFHRACKGETDSAGAMPLEYLQRYQAGGTNQKMLFKLFVEGKGQWCNCQLIEEQKNENKMRYQFTYILNTFMFSGLLPCLALAFIAQGVGGMVAKPSRSKFDFEWQSQEPKELYL